MNIEIPNSVTKIGRLAFGKCTGLTNITIGNSVKTIEEGAFAGCISLKEVHINSLSAWCKIDFSKQDTNPLYYAEKLFLNGTEISELTIPDDITEIKKYTFYKCSNLTSLTIPNSVTNIGDAAFQNCI